MSGAEVLNSPAKPIPETQLLTTGSHAVGTERESLRRLLAGLIAILLCVGVQMVHSASLTSRPRAQDAMFLGKHLSYLVLAAGCAWVASRVRPGWLQQNSGRLLWVVVFLLVALLIPGIGSRINGAQRWLRLGSLSLQPSELGRIVLPLIAATSLVRLRATSGFLVSTIPETLWPLVIVLPLVAVEPDLGATLFLGAGFVLTLFIGGWPMRYFVASASMAVPVGASLLFLRPYQMERITGFMAAWRDQTQAPWQIRQSLLSLGSGGLEGTGIGGGWQKLSYLPEANTDFVFAVIGEELGLLGTMTVCLLWMAVFIVGRAVLKHLPRTSFEWILGTALLLQLILQAMVNIAVVTALVPPKGVPHPFISFGGTNQLVSLTAIGLIIGMSRSSRTDS